MSFQDSFIQALRSSIKTAVIAIISFHIPMMLYALIIHCRELPPGSERSLYYQQCLPFDKVVGGVLDLDNYI